jgi:hypothetical protein
LNIYIQPARDEAMRLYMDSTVFEVNFFCCFKLQLQHVVLNVYSILVRPIHVSLIHTSTLAG